MALFCRASFVSQNLARASFNTIRCASSNADTLIFSNKNSTLLFTGYQHILVEKQGSKSNVGLITLNRPKALNALCDALMREVSTALDELENDKEIGALVITGSERAFAAGIN